MEAALGLFASLAVMAAMVILLWIGIEAFKAWLVRRYGRKVVEK